ncbi:MAG: hypothetical protein J6Q82_03560 [Clostridia bacterium]|nr:hypothetical protein [Clostridia bacterium]
MMKRIISLILCLLMILPVLAGCAKDPDDKGAQISMYLTDPLYNFDPAAAYGNEAALRVISLIYDNLFVLDAKGKVQKSLVEKYKIIEDEKNNEYKMHITLKETSWSDKVVLQANDVADTWQRILDVNNSYECASLLFDIKGARAAKEGNISIDDVGIQPVNEHELIIFFEGKIDYDQFLLKLTSFALAPVRRTAVNAVEDYNDWAKSPAIFPASGPYKVREVVYSETDGKLLLERNPYYLRDQEKDDEDKYVRPYRLIVDYSKTDEEIMSAYENGDLFFIGDIPLSVRGDWKDVAEISDAMSTHSYVLNENAVIRYYNKDYSFKSMQQGKLPFSPTLVEGQHGEKIFANENVRKALSLAIDREAIAEAVVFAKAATALVPYGVFEKDSKRDLFREVGGDILATSANMEAAKAALDEAGIDPSEFMFSISVPAYDDVHVAIAEMVTEAWNELGFHVALVPEKLINNSDIQKATGEPLLGVKDDVFAENYKQGKFEVAAIDYVAFTPDPLTVLAPFAKYYTGGAAIEKYSTTFNIPVHFTGYNNPDFDEKINDAFEETDAKKRATLLHEAEEILMEDLPIIPVVYNQNAMLVNKDVLSRVKFDYYGSPKFAKLKMKDYQLYIPSEEEEEDASEPVAEA